jgi:hypothetical protein
MNMAEHPGRQKAMADSTATEDRREEYQPPELKDHGSVTEMTQIGAANPGADGLYS